MNLRPPGYEPGGHSTLPHPAPNIMALRPIKCLRGFG